MFKPRNVLMMLFFLLFTVAVGCGDDDKKENNNNQDLTDVRGDQDTGNVDNDTSSEADVEEGDTTTEPPTCTPLSPAIGTCDALCNTGCGAGEACMTAPVQGGAIESQCVPTGPGGQGDACGQTGNCKEGFACLSSDGTTASCLQYCRPNVNDATQCGAGLVCAGFSQSVPGLGVCIQAPDDGCTTYPNTGCEDNEQCYDAQGGGTICAPFNASAKAGDTCASANACNKGQICAGSGASGACQDICPTPGDNTGCEDGKQCQGVSGKTFGICTGA